MLRCFTLLLPLLAMMGCPSLEGAGAKLNWTTDFDEASIKAKREKKSLLLFFTGSDWCGWCHKLEGEAFDTTDFSDAAGNDFLFLVVDFPLKTALDPKLSEQNKNLQKKYGVEKFPTVVLLDENGQLIGQTGYLSGGGKLYAEHLKGMVESYKNYKKKVGKIDPLNINEGELVSLYAKANKLCRKDDAARIVHFGIQKKDNDFFLLERYRLLAHEGKVRDAESLSLREQLLKKNSPKLHYEMALIEFEAYSKENNTPEIVVAPLLSYIDRYSEENDDRLWQLHMLMAQAYLDHNQFKEALKEAKTSHAYAPESAQSDIHRFIVNIQR